MLLLHACTYAWIPTYPRETRKTGQDRKGKERKGKERNEINEERREKGGIGKLAVLD